MQRLMNLGCRPSPWPARRLERSGHGAAGEGGRRWPNWVLTSPNGWYAAARMLPGTVTLGSAKGSDDTERPAMSTPDSSGGSARTTWWPAETTIHGPFANARHLLFEHVAHGVAWQIHR